MNISCCEIGNMKNIIFSAKFTLIPLGVTLVNLRGREHKLPETFWRMFELVIDLWVLSIVIICIANTQISSIQARKKKKNVLYLTQNTST